MMADDDLDADIARMVQQHRARKTLGWSYFDGTHRSAARQVSKEERHRLDRERQQAYRERKRSRNDR